MSKQSSIRGNNYFTASSSCPNSLFADPLWHLPEHLIKNLMRQLDRLLDCLTSRDHPNIELLLTGQPDARDHARTHVDQGAIGTRDVSVGVEPSLPRPVLSAPYRLPDECEGNAALKHLGRQVAPMFAAQRKPCRDPRRRQRFDWGRNVFATSFASNDEIALAYPVRKHGDSIGEYKKIQ